MPKIFQLTIIALLTLLSQIGSGQSTFTYGTDYPKILAKSKDPSDSLSFDKLLARFAINDPTLTEFEVLALLIGYTGKNEFKPYLDLNTEGQIFKLNSDGQFNDALKLANAFLQDHPVSQQALVEKAYAFHKLSEEDSANFYLYKFRLIMKAMAFSGDGIDKPIFALGPADGQNFIHKYLASDIGSMGSGADKSGNFLDLLEVIPKDGSSSYTLRFVIQHATLKMFTDDFKAPDNDRKKKKKSSD